MRISALTWNTHNGRSLESDIKGILRNYVFDEDIVFVALQEQYYPIKDSKIYISRVFEGYCLVSFDRLFGLYSIILSRHKHLKVTHSKLGLGPFGFGNKGGIFSLVEFEADGFRFNMLHLNLHLTPHVKNQNARMKRIEECFRAICGVYDMAGIDLVILSGDLNFRVMEPAQCTIFNAIDGNNLGEILKKDQLLEFKRRYPIFREDDITFKPTYKYIINTHEYSHDAHKVPSWCDRVLYASKYELIFDKYVSIESVTSSDHKPVISSLAVNISRKIRDGKLLDLIPEENLNYKLVLTQLYCFAYEHIFGVLAILCIATALILSKNRSASIYRCENGENVGPST
jgi:hypothetical protein